MLKLKIFACFLILLLLFLLCGCRNNENNGNIAHSHQYEKTLLVEEGCEQAREYKYVCSCGDSYSEIIEPQGHDFGEWLLVEDASIESQGLIRRVCSTNLEHIEEIILPKLGDDIYEYNVVQQPSNRDAGLGKYVYQIDGQKFSFDVMILPLGHNYDEGVLTKEPMCAAEGSKTYTCIDCGDTFIELLPMTGHEFSEWIVLSNPSYETEGKIKRVCAVDESHFELFSLPKLNSQSSYEYMEVTQPTCFHKGKVMYSYVKDDQSFTFEVEVNELGHVYGSWNLVIDPTKDTTGVLAKICSNDASHKEIFTLPKLSIENGYTYAVVTAAKCENTGVGRYSYTKDGQAFTFDITLDELGHNYYEWSVIVNPTTTSEGKLESVCNIDESHVDTFVLPKLSTTNGYTYEIITPATNTTDGLGRYTYIKETQTFTFDVVIAASATEFDPR